MEKLNAMFRKENGWHLFCIILLIILILWMLIILFKSLLNYFYKLSHTMQKTDRIYLEERSIIDDQGVIFEKKSNINNWA